MQQAEKMSPRIDPLDNKLTWNENDTFMLSFPIDLTFIDSAGQRVVFAVHPEDKVITTFYRRMDNSVVHQFVNQNIRDSKVLLNFNDEVTQKFKKGDYRMSMVYEGDLNNFVTPIADDFADINKVIFLDYSKQEFSPEGLNIKLVGQDGNIYEVSGTIVKSDDSAISQFPQLESNYVLPMKVFVGGEYANNQVSIRTQYENFYYDNLVDANGYLHCLVDLDNMPAEGISLTLIVATQTPKIYTLRKGTLLHQGKTVIHISTELSTGTLQVGELANAQTLKVIGKTPLTNGQYYVPIRLYVGKEAYNFSLGASTTPTNVTLAANNLVQADGTVLLNLIALPGTDQVLTVEIVRDGCDNLVFTIDLTEVEILEQISPIASIPTDCKYVTRCQFHEGYSRCANCPLKAMSMTPVPMRRTLMLPTDNEVKVL